MYYNETEMVTTRSFLLSQRQRVVHAVVFLVLIYSTAALIAGCGFRLRGSIELPAELTKVAIEGTRPNGELGVALRNGLARVGGQVVDSAEFAQSVLVITQDSSSRRVLSVDSIGQANEYELAYTLGFRLDDPDGTNRVVQQSINLRRQYRYNPDQTLAKADEEVRLVREMREDAVRQMLRRLKAGLDNPVPTTPKASSSAPAS
jgi:LPS-assembly lipoprotein